jgi:hypothetical protein
VPVLDQGMAHEAEPGRLPLALAIEPCIGIGLAFMRVIGALLPMEIALATRAPAMAARPSHP